MKILAIETSCDDTCAAIVKTSGPKTRPRFKILSNIVSSQVEIHRKWGGVYPFLAKREHQRNLPTVLRKALKKAGFEISNSQFPISKQIPSSKFQIPKIDLIAVTVGPGLEPCLWTAVNFTKNLAKKWNLPIVPVNHIEAHILANWLSPVGDDESLAPHRLCKAKFGRVSISNLKNIFPAICLVVSGGHTQLILMKNFGEYKILGETRDDAAGECFDKVAKILGLGYPGGPAIAAKAAQFSISNSQFSIRLPRPMMKQKNYDFSFSGLKTAVLYHHKSQPEKIRKSKKYIQTMAAEMQQAVIDVLIHKTLRAARDYRVKTVLLGGGVTANEELKKQFNSKLKNESVKFNFLVPPKYLCTDNAAMVAACAAFHWPQGKVSLEKIEANANLRV